MYFKSENTKIGIKTYIILALLLAIYFIGFTFIRLYNNGILSRLNGEYLLMYIVGIAVGIVVSIFLLKEYAEII